MWIDATHAVSVEKPIFGFWRISLSEETKTRLEIWGLRLDLLVKVAVCVLIGVLVFFPGTILSSLNSGDVKVSDVEIFGVKIKMSTARA